MIRLLFVIALVVGISPALADEKTWPADGEIALGGKGAGHELVIFISPGCQLCLRIYTDTNAEILEKYVEPGHLRLVLHDVPMFFKVPKDADEADRRRALDRSLTFAGFMRCGLILGGARQFLRHLDIVAGEEKRLRIFFRKAGGMWPAVSQKLWWGTVLNLWENAGLSEAAMKPCAAPGIAEAVKKRYVANQELLNEMAEGDARRRSVPTMYLDGEPVALSGNNFSAALMNALAEGIPEAD